MARMVIVQSGAWSDLPLEELAPRVAEWGYQGIEFCCRGDHFDSRRALAEPDYCQAKLDLMNRHDLTMPVLNVGPLGAAICGPLGAGLRRELPDHVWGDGNLQGVRQRATGEMLAAVQAAQRLGIASLSGLTGATLNLTGPCEWTTADLDEALREFVAAWQPILDACQRAGVRFAAQVRPGQMAFDLHSAAWVLDALQDREAFGFAFDPAALHWQGVDPAEFVRRFPDRIGHVHLKDVVVRLNGRNSLLATWPPGDARRGWDYRSPGHGGLDWESLIRALNDVGYDGPLSVDWQDPGMDRDWGAEDACKFLQRLDFPCRRQDASQAFRPSH